MYIITGLRETRGDMPYFELDGYGRDTGRKRHRSFEARTAEDAIAQASADGTIVDVGTVKRCYPIRHFFSKVVGVTHTNVDGSDRQRILQRCSRFEQLLLRRDKGNRNSSHAVAVFRKTGEQCGYLPDDTAEDVVDGLKRDHCFLCFAIHLTGGDAPNGKPTFGLNLLLVTFDDPDTPLEAVDKYVNGGGVNLDD